MDKVSVISYEKPNYKDGSIVNLVSSVVAGMSGNFESVNTLRLMPPAEIADATNIILFVVDGLGYNFLINRGRDTFLHENLRGSVTSVFPTTTAAAITSFVTGLTPKQHAVTGWFVYIKELGSVMTVLPYKPRYGGSPLKKSEGDIKEILCPTSIFEKLTVDKYVVTDKKIVDSDFSIATTKSAKRFGYKNINQCFDQIAKIVKSSKDKKYIYSYWPELDGMGHHFGVNSLQVSKGLNKFDQALSLFIESIRGHDTTVIVTADHGMLDTEPQKVIHLEEHPELADTLILPLCGEPRAAYCYVKPRKIAQFKDYITQSLNHCCACYPSEDFIESGYFGLGDQNPNLVDRIGDFTLVMKENYVIKDRLAGESPFTQIGVHGGLSLDELLVPLIVVKS